jgi:hypothetical protein
MGLLRRLEKHARVKAEMGMPLWVNVGNWGLNQMFKVAGRCSGGGSERMIRGGAAGAAVAHEAVETPPATSEAGQGIELCVERPVAVAIAIC